MRLANLDGIIYVAVQDYIEHLDRSVNMVKLMGGDSYSATVSAVIACLDVTRDHLQTLLVGGDE